MKEEKVTGETPIQEEEIELLNIIEKWYPVIYSIQDSALDTEDLAKALQKEYGTIIKY